MIYNNNSEDFRCFVDSLLVENLQRTTNDKFSVLRMQEKVKNAYFWDQDAKTKFMAIQGFTYTRSNVFFQEWLRTSSELSENNRKTEIVHDMENTSVGRQSTGIVTGTGIVFFYRIFISEDYLNMFIHLGESMGEHFFKNPYDDLRVKLLRYCDIQGGW